MGIFDRFKRNRDETAPLAATLSEAQLDELRETAREWIRAGFHEKAELPTELADYRDDFEVVPEVVLRAATTIVDEEWAVRVGEQQTWSGDTDHAKVQRAFDALAAQGIVGRMNFTCCQTCGTSEIDDERMPLADAKQEVIQRSEIMVGTAVADALRAEGLEVEWDGSTQSRIRVAIADWRKPLPSAD